MKRFLFILCCATILTNGHAIQYEYYNRNAQYNAAHKYGGQVGVLTPGTSQGFGVLSALTNLEEVDSEIASGQKAINIATLNQKAPTESAVTSYVSRITDALQTRIDGKQDYISDLASIRSGAAAGATAVQPSNLATVATTGAYSDLSGAPTVGAATITIQKNGTQVDSFSANATADKIINITVPTTASDVNALSSSIKYGASLSMSIDNATYVITTTLKDQDGNNLGTAQTIDLPLETMVVNAEYNDNSKKIILTLKNGNTVDFSVADLVAGLQTEITSDAKLSADLVDDTSATNKFVTASDKTTWNNKVDKVSTANRVYGTDANGDQTSYDKNSFGQVDDVKIGNSSVVSNKIASLGTAAAAATTDFATAAQGTKADTSVQPGDNISGLVNDAGYLTAHQSLSDLGLTATAAELNVLDGITATTTELNYVDGVTSNIQTQLNGKQATLTIDTSLSNSSVNTAVPGALATYNFASDAANLTSGNLPYARVSNIVGTAANTIAAGDDSRFNSVPTSQPSGSVGTGRAFIWVQ